MADRRRGASSTYSGDDDDDYDPSRSARSSSRRSAPAAGTAGSRRPNQRAKIYHCDSPGCESSFDRPSSLSQHKLSHTGEKPYACSQCNRRFSTSSNTKRHAKTCTSQRVPSPPGALPPIYVAMPETRQIPAARRGARHVDTIPEVPSNVERSHAHDRESPLYNTGSTEGDDEEDASGEDESEAFATQNTVPGSINSSSDWDGRRPAYNAGAPGNYGAHSVAQPYPSSIHTYPSLPSNLPDPHSHERQWPHDNYNPRAATFTPHPYDHNRGSPSVHPPLSPYTDPLRDQSYQGYSIGSERHPAARSNSGVPVHVPPIVTSPPSDTHPHFSPSPSPASYPSGTRSGWREEPGVHSPSYVNYTAYSSHQPPGPPRTPSSYSTTTMSTTSPTTPISPTYSAGQHVHSQSREYNSHELYAPQPQISTASSSRGYNNSSYPHEYPQHQIHNPNVSTPALPSYPHTSQYTPYVPQHSHSTHAPSSASFSPYGGSHLYGAGIAPIQGPVLPPLQSASTWSDTHSHHIRGHVGGDSEADRQ